MTDRELLEAAARAINLPECGWMGPAFVYVNEDDVFTKWNPLEDDGDALRLAVSLNMSVAMGPVRVQACTIDGSLRGEFFQESRIDMEPCTATRRAIVRAAAEIGLKEQP